MKRNRRRVAATVPLMEIRYEFGFPLPAGRIREIEAGRIEPMRFDYTGLD